MSKNLSILNEYETYGTALSTPITCKETHSNQLLYNLVSRLKTYMQSKQVYIQLLKYMVRLLFSLFLFSMSAMLGKIVTMVYVIPRVNVNIPPSPDILLDSFQHSLPQAFKATEAISLMLVVILVLISLLHTKERSYILPRYLFLSASLINLRTLCISITTFSIPSRELSETCSNLQQLSTETLWRKSINFMDFSETCGDYVFSGHATALVISAWFVWYYGRSLSFITNKNTLKKLMNFLLCSIVLIGLMCILFAKEHYTVDVVLGAVISVMWCALYHSMLENYRNSVNGCELENEHDVERYEICNISSILYWWFTIFDNISSSTTSSEMQLL